MRYCETHADVAQSLYFRNLGAGPAHPMLFYTSAGALILGLSVVEGEGEWLARLKEYPGSSIGYLTFEAAPATSAGEFRFLAARDS
jgi:hypothetical protein